MKYQELYPSGNASLSAAEFVWGVGPGLDYSGKHTHRGNITIDLSSEGYALQIMALLYMIVAF
jgi:hypothetical protein